MLWWRRGRTERRGDRGRSARSALPPPRRHGDAEGHGGGSGRHQRGRAGGSCPWPCGAVPAEGPSSRSGHPSRSGREEERSPGSGVRGYQNSNPEAQLGPPPGFPSPWPSVPPCLRGEGAARRAQVTQPPSEWRSPEARFLRMNRSFRGAGSRGPSVRSQVLRSSAVKTDLRTPTSLSVPTSVPLSLCAAQRFEPPRPSATPPDRCFGVRIFQFHARLVTGRIG